MLRLSGLRNGITTKAHPFVTQNCRQRRPVDGSALTAVSSSKTTTISAASASGASYHFVTRCNQSQQLRFFSETSNSNPQDDNNGSNNNNNNDKISSSSSPSSLSAIVPRRGYGDEAPRMPHVLALPVLNRPLFPGVVTSVTLTEPATIDALENLQRSNSSSNNTTNNYISVFLRSKHPTGVSEGGVLLPTPEVITDPSDLYKVGTFAQIHRLTRGVGSVSNHPSNNTNTNHKEFDADDPSSSGTTGGGGGDGDTASVLLLAHRRVNLESVDSLGPPIDVTISHWPRLDYTGSDDTIRALSNEILSTIREVAQINPLFRENVAFFSMRLDANDPYRLADFAASICSAGKPEDLQAVLEEKDPEMRLHKALVLLSKEREVSKLQQEIQSKVEEKMTEAQRRYFLMEQLKSIKKELGMERDDKEAVIEKYRKQLNNYPDIPEDVLKTINSELEKLSSLEMNSSEYNVTRNYLDWLCGVPWNVMSDENFDIKDARKVLDRDHYGLDDVKDTILEFIAVGKLKGSVQGKIICLSGPPGTGKTSIAKSVAEALGREFYRFSVGGLSNVSEIKGHRRTYIGAMPGKIIQSLKTTGTFNPVVLIDEIDKLGYGYQGDPASALLEVLDPSQNSSFMDHYLDEPVDISKVLFMCTANELERIPEPLLDRMEVIRLSGYDFPEKVAIGEQYLVPKSMRDNGLLVNKTDLSEDDDAQTVDAKDEIETPLGTFVHAKGVPSTLGIAKEAIESIVRWYAREAGVRNLSKYIDKITRKLALQVVAEEEGTQLTKKSSRKTQSWTVNDDNLEEYIGKRIFQSDRLYEKDPLPDGIVMGLAYTSMGGSALYIETQGIKRGVDENGKPRGGGTIRATGKLGDVMKESSQIAYTVARARLADIEPENNFFDITDIHMHVPEGATPKDGPSAGIAMVTSMLSLAMKKPIRNDLAMTGEISLTGKVLPVGGIKEKIMGGRRAGIKTIILPAANRRDYDEIPDYLKEGLEVHFADEYQSVYNIALSGDNHY
ncbi:lon protease [Nitzschia inconspicua]|uniref:Lon protease homolog, mitochondrial n=1 Tax=Nitzschia inconspicua TaxID=303405 RepID=A0A9K3K9R6_9STRA|nr:lon protease [Nitzschia inconspicua]KAG7359433.1 lon protease [Nitzschia inconspicua]